MNFKFSGVIIPLIFAASATIASSPNAHAENLKDLLPPLLKSHNLVKAAESDVEAAEERIKAARGGWFPTATVTANYGKEIQNKPTDAVDTNMVPRETDLSVTQLLWDFGVVNSQIRSAGLTAKASDFTLESTKQDLILRAITAFINVDRSAKVLGFARESEGNIKKQMELEDALVKKGAGLSSDVLQAKATLAGAQARRVQAEGALAVARNAYRAVFHTDVSDLSALESPILQPELIPATVMDAIQIALRENPKLLTADMGARVATETIKSTRASSFYPTINMTAEAKYKNDVGATFGEQHEKLAKVELSFPFNLGFTAINTLKASKGDASSANLRVSETKDLIEQLVRDSWSNLKTARSTHEFLTNQSNIQSEFLELARKERKLGNRTLLDVLNGETALINANSDATSASADVAIATFTLLNAMGRLTLNMVQ